MLIYHQCGHNFVWNVESCQEDGVGAGLILSPVNMPPDRIFDRIPSEVRARSWMDPQFYLPHDSKSELANYSYFPGNVLDDFTTTDYQSHALEVAQECLGFQRDLGLRQFVIPTRHFDDLPEDYLNQLSSIFVEPFLTAYDELGLSRPLMLTVIAKAIHLEPGIQRDELLTWATAHQDVHGIYLIF